MRAALLIGRLVFLGIPVVLPPTGSGAVDLLILTILLWSVGEGIALPLWTSLLAGLVPPIERGRWLATRAAVAAGVPAIVLLAALVSLQFLASATTLRIACVVAALGGLASVGQLRGLIRITPPMPVPPARSARHFPAAPAARRFLRGVLCFLFRRRVDLAGVDSVRHPPTARHRSERGSRWRRQPPADAAPDLLNVPPLAPCIAERVDIYFV